MCPCSAGKVQIPARRSLLIFDRLIFIFDRVLFIFDMSLFRRVHAANIWYQTNTGGTSKSAVPASQKSRVLPHVTHPRSAFFLQALPSPQPHFAMIARAADVSHAPNAAKKQRQSSERPAESTEGATSSIGAAVRMHICIPTCVCVCACVHVYINTCMYIYICIYTKTNIRVYIYDKWLLRISAASSRNCNASYPSENWARLSVYHNKWTYSWILRISTNLL